MTKPTPEQIQRACDLINTEARAGGDGSTWNPLDFDVFPSLKVLADTIAQLDAKDAMIDGQAALIATLTAERDKARADLAEIYIQLDGVSGMYCLADDSRAAIESAHDLASPYRVETDPLVAMIEGISAYDGCKVADVESFANRLLAELAKRGLEIGRQA